MSQSQTKKIDYPYIHPSGKIEYLPDTDKYMRKAKAIAKRYKSNLHHPAAALVVKDNQILGEGSIGNNPYHLKGCLRVKLNMPTGEGYDLCKGCSPKYHSEAATVTDAKAKNADIAGAALYLWGHWWCCKDCWDVMVASGVHQVYLLENSETLFNKQAKGNIVGRQFST